MRYSTEFNFDTFPFTKEARKTLDVLGLTTEKEKNQLERDMCDFLICTTDDIPTEMGINCFLEEKRDVIAEWYGYENWEELVKDSEEEQNG